MATQMTSKIRICKGINIDRNYVNVTNYSETQMLNLCESNEHLVASANDYSFIRNRGTISTSFSYLDCLRSNYIAFQNKDYSNKWFFAWIDEVNYIGENNTEIKYTIDSWSTWFSYWTAKTCFVIREHVTNDTIGINTIPEDLNIGEVIEESETEDSSYTNEYGYWIAIASNWQPTDNSTSGGQSFSGITTYNNVTSGNKIFLFKITSSLSSFQSVGLFLIRTNGDGHIADVQNIFIVPNAMIDELTLTQHTSYVLNTSGGSNYEFTYYTMPNNTTVKKFNTTISKLTSFSGFTPKNNKCFVYPYNYLFVSNNQGSNNIFKYENFSTTNCIFENQLAITIGGSGRLVPKNYKGMSTNDDESLTLGKYPTCSWSSDAFTNWLTQNAVNIPVNIITSAASYGLSATKPLPKASSEIGYIGSQTLSISNTIGNVIGEFYLASLLPNISSGQASGDVTFANNKNVFTFRKMRVKNEYLSVIDDYFTRFGYKINRVKVPNITGRTYWNYIEIGSSEDIGYGDVPSKYMEIINNACRKGVTIWHNHSNIGNYSLNNTIVS